MKIRAAGAWLALLLVGAAVLANPGSARAAATITWTGLGVSNNWSEAANWDTGVPAAGDTIVFPVSALRRANTNNLPPASFVRIRFDGSGYSVTGNPLTITGDILNQPDGGTNFLALDVGGAGSVRQLSGRLALTGDNSYGGSVSIEGGALQAASDHALGNATGETVVMPGATLQVAGAVNTGAEVIHIQGDGFDLQGALQSFNGGNTVGMLRLAGNARVGVLAGTLVVGNLGQDAPATLTLVGGGKLQVDVSTFAGVAEVAEGNFTFNASSAVAVNVGRFGWLRGTGTIASANVTAGLVWPGSGNLPGILTVLGPTAFTSGTFKVDIDGPGAGTGYGQLRTAGLALNPAATVLEIELDSTPPVGQVFTIIRNTGSPVAGTFTNLPEGATIQAGGYVFRISYTGIDGNDVTLTVVRRVAADIKVELTASPSPAAQNGLLAFTATVTNEGPDDATSPSLTLGTPEGTTFDSFIAPAGWACSKPSPSPSVGCVGPKLPNGQSASIILKFKVIAGPGSVISATAGVNSPTPDPFSADNSATLTVPVGSGGPGVPLPYRRFAPGVASDSARGSAVPE